MNFFLGPRNWVVEEVTESWFKKNVDNSANYGWCDEETSTIYLIAPKGGKWKNKTFRDITLKHEIIHAMLFSLGIRDNHDEQLIDGLAHMWQHYEDTLHE